jgi:hypothetical protein
VNWNQCLNAIIFYSLLL